MSSRGKKGNCRVPYCNRAAHEGSVCYYHFCRARKSLRRAYNKHVTLISKTDCRRCHFKNVLSKPEVCKIRGYCVRSEVRATEIMNRIVEQAVDFEVRKGLIGV